MANYIEIQNSNKRAIINDSYKNLSLNRVITNDKGEADFVVSLTDNELPFFTCDNNNVSISSYRFKGYVKFFLRLNNFDMSSTRTDSNDAYKSFKVYIFGTHTNVATYGLQIFNDSGESIFNSNNKYLDIIDYVFEYGFTENMVVTSSKRFSYDKRIGVCLTSVSSIFLVATPMTSVHMFGVNIDSYNSFVLKNNIFSAGINPQALRGNLLESKRTNILVCDLSFID